MITTSSGQQVETYEAEDASHSDASTLAADHEAIELIASLGLKGQEKLVNAGTVTRVPYRAMEAREALVYGTLFDGRSKVEEYSGEAIPLRVLQVIAHARECGLFNGGLVIWHPKTHVVRDPVLIGITKTRTYPDDDRYASLTTDTFYILARWGKALLPLEQLEAMATDLCRKARLHQLNDMAAKLRLALEVTKDSLDLRYLAQQPYANGLD